MGGGPLGHLRVVDLTDLRGALAGRILADLGAEVLKVESPGGDPGRMRPPFAGGVAAADRSLPFLFRNANRRGLVLDLHDADGWHRFLTLCEAADVLIENLGPAAAAHGLTPAEVRARHPRLVHLSLRDFGHDGPHAGWRLEPLPAMAASGALFICGFPDLPPCGGPGYLAHDCGSVFGVAGALAAILERARTGRGQTVEVSVQEAALHGLHPWTVPTADYARRKPIVPPVPRRTGDGTHLVLPVADGWIRALPSSPRQWRAFLALLGTPDALAGPEWEAAIYRLGNSDVIRIVAGEILSQRRKADVIAEGLRLDVPIVPLNTPEQYVDEEQTRSRGAFAVTDFPHLAGAPLSPGPFRFSGTPVALRLPAPALGGDGVAGFATAAAEAGTPARVAAANAGGPVLAGLRVVDLGVGVAVPEAGWLLAELGAEVVKIESRANPDFLRRVTAEPGDIDHSMLFNDSSRGHLSVALDLTTETGRVLARRLCARADVVLENNRGGVARRWELDYDAVRALRPDVIYYLSQAFGADGPLGEASAYGPLVSAFTGLTWLWNHPEAPYPGGMALNHPDHVAAKLGVAAILAALEHRRRTGEGQRIEMSQAEAAAYLIGELYLEARCTGGPARQRGNAVDWACPYGVYPCAGKERWVAIAVVGDGDWERFVRCVGWEPEPELATLSGRLARRAELDGRLAEWTRSREAAAVAATLQAAGVSAMPALDADDLRADPHLAARGAIVTLEDPDLGPVRHAGNPLRMSATPFVTAGPAPRLGEHTVRVLGDWLGLAPEEIARLEADGICR